jgi:hypothetical protein
VLREGDRVYHPQSGEECLIEMILEKEILLSTGDIFPSWEVRLIPQPGDRVTLINGLYTQWLNSVYKAKKTTLKEKQSSLSEKWKNKQWDGFQELKALCEKMTIECDRLSLDLEYFELGFLNGSKSHWSEGLLPIRTIQQGMAIVIADNERRSVPVNCLGVIERQRIKQEVAA